MNDKIREMDDTNYHIIIEGEKYIVGEAYIAYFGHNVFGDAENGYCAPIHNYDGEIVGFMNWKQVNWDLEDESDRCDWYSPDEVWLDDVEMKNYKVV